MPEPRDLPLFRWGAELRRTRAARRLRLRLAAGGIGVGLIGLTIIAPPAPRLVWNVSASAPMGLYRVRPGAALARGDMVVARTPDGFRELAARRRYVPANVPLVKRVAAAPGDLVCAIGEQIYVNARAAASRLWNDAGGRPMPWWTGCRLLGAGDYLLLMQAPGSFDGRYFGPVSGTEIIGKAVPLWVR